MAELLEGEMGGHGETVTAVWEGTTRPGDLTGRGTICSTSVGPGGGGHSYESCDM